MKTIRFIVDKPPYSFHQIVQFKDAIADALIAQGVAIIYNPNTLPPPPPPPGPLTLNNNTPIQGNPPEFDTPAEMAAALQALQTWKQLADPDNDGDLVEEINMPLIVATVGQTQFTLPRAPQNPMSAVLTAGETPFHPSPQTFTITGTNLTWHFPAQLVPTDKLFISYR